MLKKQFISLAAATAVASTMAVFGGIAPAQADDPDPIWLDTSYSFSERAAALVSQMTVAEKILQLDDKPPAIERLGLASYDYWNEALHGVVAAGTTMFPSPTAIGSTWNRSLVSTLGNVIGDEARALNNRDGKGLTYWSPTLNISRDPRWGRADESYGEDPFLIGQIGEQFIKGVQGNDSTYLKAISTPKHYFANNSESNRRNGNAEATEREIREYYTPAFAHAMSPEVGAYSFMTAYNRVNGVPMSGSKEYLETMAKRQWGFSGYITTDCSAVQDMYNRHLWVPDGWDHSVTPAEAVAWALKAGSDIDCQGDSYTQSLQSAYDAGLITDGDLDAQLTALLTGRFRLGEFDSPNKVPYTKPAYTNIATASQQAASQAVSNEAPVLLKNDNIVGGNVKGLPLTSADAENIAVVGYLSDVFVSGGYSGSAPVDERTFNEALAQVAASVNPDANVEYVGSGVTPGVTSGAMDICEIFFGPGYDPANTGGMTCPMWWSTTTASGKPGVQNVTFKNASGTDVGQPIVATDSSNGYPLSITDDPQPERFIIWEGWMGINWGYADYMRASSVWGGYFGVRHDFSGQESQLCVAQSGTPAEAPTAGVFQVHLDSLTGPLVATVPAEGNASTCGTPDGTAEINRSLSGIHDLYFVYDNGTLGDFGEEGTAGHPYAYNLDADAEQKIADADAVIVVVGTTNAEASEEMDRVNIDLPRFQDELVNKVAELNKHTVVWTQSVGTMDIEKFRNNPNVPSIVWTNYNGQHQSITAANTIFGRNNPSGKLPMTWYSDLDQLGSVWDYGITPATTDAGHGRTYQYFDGAVSYPFGYGLSYSDFSYSNLKLDKSSATGDDTITASVTVSNNSSTAGKETVELYAISPKADGKVRPLKQLRGFEKVSVPGNGTATATIKVSAADLWFWDDKADKESWDLGNWCFQVGPDSDRGAKACFELTSEPTMVLDIVKAVPDGTVLNTAAPGTAIHANLSATRVNETFYDLGDPSVKVEYSVKDPAVASVDANGTVSAVGKGITTVTATVTVGSLTKSDSFPVVVQAENATTPVIDIADQTVQLKNAAAIPVNATVKLLPAGKTATVTYLIAAMDENTADATVNEATGVVKATKIGKVRVTALAEVDEVKISRSAEITVIADEVEPPVGGMVTIIDALIGSGSQTSPATAKVGALLRAKVVTEPAEADLTFQWYRDGVSIAGATGEAYTVVEEDLDSYISYVVTASRPGWDFISLESESVLISGVPSGTDPTDPSDPSDPSLPRTGAETGPWVIAAALFLALGISLVLFGNRRRRQAE
ncbi:MAG: glycoside hydrolase family 3 C-terminal domain-containing protein [Propionibacteriaceae bacterium]|jgi:beta-glucosidase|nr:glycoside hydrolase family 3 C-terminal domain-containing protein [Propionibacteriaceae bacterium]